MSSSFSIHRDRHGSINHVGIIDRESMTFSYDEGYLQSTKAAPLSFSLPLRPQPYNETEFRPYFEGSSLRAMLEKSWLANCGFAKATIYRF